LALVAVGRKPAFRENSVSLKDGKDAYDMIEKGMWEKVTVPSQPVDDLTSGKGSLAESRERRKDNYD